MGVAFQEWIAKVELDRKAGGSGDTKMPIINIELPKGST